MERGWVLSKDVKKAVESWQKNWGWGEEAGGEDERELGESVPLPVNWGFYFFTQHSTWWHLCVGVVAFTVGRATTQSHPPQFAGPKTSLWDLPSGSL